MVFFPCFPLILRRFLKGKWGQKYFYFAILKSEVSFLWPDSWFPPSPPLTDHYRILHSLALCSVVSCSTPPLGSGLAHLSTFTQHHAHSHGFSHHWHYFRSLISQQSPYTCWCLHRQVSGHNDKLVNTRRLFKCEQWEPSFSLSKEEVRNIGAKSCDLGIELEVISVNSLFLIHIDTEMCIGINACLSIVHIS